ncbi:MAG: Poly-beta-1,6-N-acetyl-D-glucosamine synthase [Candidatus Accumulibacter regalis]|jgi:rSAM/selenodomain-associated transferase 2|uniref:Poly-beta-1,6-N-acetyl-D-glucosamine synthase n=1 Tax=Accumulibacter regalis TaxID=522306 RepID=A0A011PHT5_ACCRE|nr:MULTISPECIES: TIGR04283 family arsenosugar biosynthesis glycosyltransferase [unclassified Candidatus Accumulibacter]EXI87131.1 MAG: Poly-beta-1,6-N-acetyl-D-glucosamine synthase [Candidatus Accumulibacter regalis]MQM33936.1 glycosyl transferase [Candidatus Accumulibacter phosphatis]MBL8367197.1 TIGR04283 family arsenosugar biosynthesis glycosyltransferase [Accumulibacter sp.]MBN8515720.1 TIGR04283 family arsenosugar biosynthesis glycosyltransferase [Accumulibacter sp.]HRE71706.1 TIGR04283 f
MTTPDDERPFLSLILPVLNEAPTLATQLAQLQCLRARGAELLVVDGGSSDGTLALAADGADRLLDSPRGRALQMNAGARASRGEVLLFVHADTTLPRDADALIRAAIVGGATWGRFDVTIASRHRLLRIVAAMMNWRSRLTGIATGDQAIFVRREAFLAVGAFPELALMEDIALCKRLKAIASPACLRARVSTSGRRWEKHGVLRTIVLMWRLRASYFLGADPAQLALRYGYSPRQP